MVLLGIRAVEDCSRKSAVAQGRSFNILKEAMCPRGKGLFLQPEFVRSSTAEYSQLTTGGLCEKSSSVRFRFGRRAKENC